MVVLTNNFIEYLSYYCVQKFYSIYIIHDIAFVLFFNHVLFLSLVLCVHFLSEIFFLLPQIIYKIKK